MSFSTLAGGTCTVSGGTSRTWTQDNRRIARGHHYVDVAVADKRLQPQVTLRSTAPVQNSSTGLWKRGDVLVTLAIPILTTSGVVSYSVYEVSARVHPELAIATDAQYRHEALQLGFNATIASVWTAGATNF